MITDSNHQLLPPPLNTDDMYVTVALKEDDVDEAHVVPPFIKETYAVPVAIHGGTVMFRAATALEGGSTAIVILTDDDEVTFL
jgi:hypothetical protein